MSFQALRGKKAAMDIAGRSESADPLPRDTVPLRALVRRFEICSWVVLFGLAVDVMGVGLQLWILHRFQELLDTYGYGHIPRDQVPDGALIDGITRISGLLGVAIFLVAFFLAMARARRIAVEAGVTGYENSFGWIIGSLFIPLINLFAPWAGLAEIRRSIFVSAREGRTGDSWTAAKGISLATLAIALLLIGCNIGEFVYDLATRQPVGHGAAAFADWLAQNNQRMMTIAAVRILKVLPLFVYLRTLRPPLLKLIALQPAPVMLSEPSAAVLAP